MWDCEKCGTMAIAGPLEACPACREPRTSPEVPAPPADALGAATATPAAEAPAGKATGKSKEGWGSSDG